MMVNARNVECEAFFLSDYRKLKFTDLGCLERPNGRTKFNKNLHSGTRVEKRGPTQVRTDMRKDVTICRYFIDAVFFFSYIFS
jgi:hypothetical protein